MTEGGCVVFLLLTAFRVVREIFFSLLNERKKLNDEQSTALRSFIYRCSDRRIVFFFEFKNMSLISSQFL